jgi:hypothetical protein
VASVANPCISANAYRADVFETCRLTGCSQVSLLWVRVAIRNAAIVGDTHVFLNNHLTIHGYQHVPAYFSIVPNNQPRLIDHSSGEDGNLAPNPNVVANLNLHVAADERQAVYREILADSFTPGLKEGKAITNGQ